MRVLDYALLLAVNEVSTTQAKLTILTKEAYQQILDYIATYNKVCVQFYASNMVLNVDSDAAYLVLLKVKSRFIIYYFLSNHSNTNILPKLNGAILVECKEVKCVLTLSAEAKTARVFHNAQTTIPI